MTSELDLPPVSPLAADAAAADGAARPLDGVEAAVWRAFVKALVTVPRGLDADLTATQGLSLTEYGVLMHLSEQDDRRLRMSALAAMSGLSLSGMTRIITRLEADGLVFRERCTYDARGLLAVLTDAGFARLETAYPSHLASVRRRVMDHLATLPLDRLAAALQSINDDSGCPDEVRDPADKA